MTAVPDVLDSAHKGEEPERWALVTGSTSGIGRATAVALAKDGYSIIVTGRDSHRAGAVCEEVHSLGGSAEPVVADLRDAAALRERQRAVGTPGHTPSRSPRAPCCATSAIPTSPTPP